MATDRAAQTPCTPQALRTRVQSALEADADPDALRALLREVDALLGVLVDRQAALRRDITEALDRYQAPRPEARARPSPVQAKATGTHVRALVADESASACQALRVVLQGLGCTVECVADGQGAVDRATQDQYDIVFLSPTMPGLDGLAAAERIRRRETADRRLTLVGLASTEEPAERKACLSAGMDECILKPVRAHRVRELLERRCGLAPAQDRAQAAPSLAPYILLIDDDPNILRGTGRVLSAAFPEYRVETADNGPEGCALLGRLRPRFVVLDLSMPGMDGREVLRFLREDPQSAGTRVLVWSALPEHDPRVREVRNQGISHLVHKPNVKDLVARMGELTAETADTHAPAAKGASEADRPAATGRARGPVFNAGQALESTGGNVERLRRLADMVLQEAPGQVDSLRKALQAGDAEAAEQWTHALMGDMANIGAERARNQALAVGSAVAASDFAEAHALAAHLPDLLDEVRGVLAQADWQALQA